MSDTVEVRVDTGTHHHDGEVYKPGDVIEIPRDTYQQHDMKFSRDTSERSDEDDSGGGGGGEFSAFDFVSRTPMSRVIEDIESGDYDDHLDDIHNAETYEKNRNGVKEAIMERRDDD